MTENEIVRRKTEKEMPRFKRNCSTSWLSEEATYPMLWRHKTQICLLFKNINHKTILYFTLWLFQSSL